MRWLSRMQAWNATQPAPEYMQPESSSLARLVPRKFDSLEVWLLLFCGGYGLVVCITALGGARDAALACVALLCMAVWRRFNPARTQTQWAVGAAVVLLIVAWIYAAPRSGGSTGPFLFLLLVLSISYPLLMDAPAVGLFTLALLGLYYGTGWHRSSSMPLEIFYLRGLLITGLALLSWRFGAVLRQAELSIDSLRRDSASLAYNEHGLARYGARYLHNCAMQMQPCTLVLMPLPHDWYAALDPASRGSEHSAVRSLKMQNRALRDMALHLTLALPPDAVVSRNPQGDWVALVPWLEPHTVLNRLELAFGRPMQLPFGPKEDEMFAVITPCAVASRGESDTVESLLARAQDIWLRGVRTGAVDHQ